MSIGKKEIPYRFKKLVIAELSALNFKIAKIKNQQLAKYTLNRFYRLKFNLRYGVVIYTKQKPDQLIWFLLEMQFLKYISTI